MGDVLVVAVMIDTDEAMPARGNPIPHIAPSSNRPCAAHFLPDDAKAMEVLRLELASLQQRIEAAVSMLEQNTLNINNIRTSTAAAECDWNGKCDGMGLMHCFRYTNVYSKHSCLFM